MVVKRKHGAFEESQQGDLVAKPAPGTQTFTSGAAVREALAQGSRQAFVAFHQQILSPHSSLPLIISHPSATILQHYQSASPTFDEVFTFWKESDKARNDKGVETAVGLLIQIIDILAGLPFFRTAVLGIVQKLVAQTEPFPELINRLVQSGKRDHTLLGLQLAASAIQVDLPDPAAPGYGSGRLALRVWNVLVEGGSAKVLGKVLGMRRRNKEGAIGYGSKDPLDRPDIRHAALHLIIPLLPLSAFHAHGKTILPAMFNHLQGDPPITIYRLLTGLWAAIASPSPGIARRTALALLDENALEKLLDLLGREDVDPTTGKSVADMTMAFLEATTTNPGRGICFPDQGWYPRQGASDKEEEEISGYNRRRDEGKMRKGLHNRILSNVIRKLGAKVLEDQGRIGEWVIKVLSACPEIVAGYWPHSALSLDPRLNARWLATIAYVGRIISLPPPDISTFHEPLPRGADPSEAVPRSSPPSVNIMVESIFPAPLGKVHLTKGLQTADLLVQHVTALALARGLQKLELVQSILQGIEARLEAQPGTSDNTAPNIWTRRRLELELECRRRVPEVLVIISFAQKSATLARVSADSDDEPDPKLVAKSALLTEVALRLFGLYHKALPSVSREAKFDVGKLLVSASSAKAERREKREAREGSVISDTGSVGSVGTIGTVGMGGGFGQSRGDVDGFEAMSQVHVLSLLTQVPDWQWTNKASGSQYSYLYHILLLHLSTPHPITKQMTTNLLNSLLLPSIMFEHDVGELEIWLSALPSLATLKDPSQRAWLVIQQIQLLSFMDECVRRCMKTPYRYLEEVSTLVPDYFEPAIRPYELVSPLFMTILEQLKAKINAQLIATEAAGVVLAYLGRVVLGLSGKMKDRRWIDEVVSKLETAVKDARSKGQERKGLLGSVRAIQRQASDIFGGDVAKDNEEPAAKMVDEEFWASQSFELRAIAQASAEGALPMLRGASNASIYRYGRFVTQLFATTANSAYLKIARCCLDLSSGVHADRLKRGVFERPEIKAALLPGSQYDQNLLDDLVTTLLPIEDGAVAEFYINEFLQSLRADKKGKNVMEILRFVAPWTPFFTATEAQEAVAIVAKVTKRLTDMSDRVKTTISSLVVGTEDPQFALERLDKFVSIDIIEPFATLLRSASSKRSRQGRFANIEIQEDGAKRILAAQSIEAYDLVKTLVEISPVALTAIVSVLSADKTLLQDVKVLPVVSSILDIPGALSSENHDALVQIGIKALTSSSTSFSQINAAQQVIKKISDIDPVTVTEQVEAISLASYKPGVAHLAPSLGAHRDSARSARHLIHIGLQYVTRFCSSDVKLDEGHLSIMKDLGKAIRDVDEVQLDLEANYVEPTVTAIIQERLAYSEASEFAALLVEKSSLKASFIRQHLSLLFSSSTYNTLASPIATTSAALTRPGFIHLLSAMFTSNPYMTCQPNFIEQLLPVYKGTLSQADQRLLSLFQLFESYRHISVASVLSAWSSSAGRSGRPFEAVTSLEPTKMLATALAFPLRRGLRNVQQMEENDGGQGLYDPSFVLPLFAMTLNNDLTGLDWVEILRTNILGVSIMALSSRDKEMRSLGNYLLAKTMKVLESVAFQEKSQLVYILRVVRHSIEAPKELASQPRLPVLISTFIAHTLRALATPANPLYPAASRFLLQRHKFDAGDVPMLFGMLYASGEGHKRDRNWIVRFIRDAARSEADWSLLKRRKTAELLQTLYSSSVDITFRRLVLQAMERMTMLPPACLSLAHRSHLVTWLNTQWAFSRLEKRKNRVVEEERSRHLTILENLVIVLVARDQGQQKKAQDEDASEAPVKKNQGREWMRPVERLLKQAAADSDLDRLNILSRIILRLSLMGQTKTLTEIFPILVDRLAVLSPSPEQDEVYVQVVERLFEASLALEKGNERARSATEEIGWRVGLLQTDVGEWIRKETRLAAWEGQ